MSIGLRAIAFAAASLFCQVALAQGGPNAPAKRRADEQNNRPHIRVIQPGTHRLVGGASVSIFTIDGQLVFSGTTDMYGMSVDLPENQRLDPALRRVRVEAKFLGGVGSSTGEIFLRYDEKSKKWRPETVYRFDPISRDSLEGEWEALSALDEKGNLLPAEPTERRVTARVMIDVYPIPIRSYIFATPLDCRCAGPCGCGCGCGCQ